MPEIRVPQTHRLKTWPEFFAAVLSGAKTAEIRKADRDYQVGDTLILAEWDNDAQEYTGREVVKLITHRLDGGQFGLEYGYCMLSLGELPVVTIPVADLSSRFINSDGIPGAEPGVVVGDVRTPVQSGPRVFANVHGVEMEVLV